MPSMPASSSEPAWDGALGLFLKDRGYAVVPTKDAELYETIRRDVKDFFDSPVPERHPLGHSDDLPPGAGMVSISKPPFPPVRRSITRFH